MRNLKSKGFIWFGMLKEGWNYFKLFFSNLKKEIKDTSMYISPWLHMFKTYQTNYNIISRFELYTMKEYCTWWAPCVFSLC